MTVCSRNTNVIIVWAWMPERSPPALCCPATKHCEYGHKMASGSLASARIPTPVSKIELLQPLQNRAVTPGWREEPVRKGWRALVEGYHKHLGLIISNSPLAAGAAAVPLPAPPLRRTTTLICLGTCVARRHDMRNSQSWIIKSGN